MSAVFSFVFSRKVFAERMARKMAEHSSVCAKEFLDHNTEPNPPDAEQVDSYLKKMWEEYGAYRSRLHLSYACALLEAPSSNQVFDAVNEMYIACIKEHKQMDPARDNLPGLVLPRLAKHEHPPFRSRSIWGCF